MWIPWLRAPLALALLLVPQIGAMEPQGAPIAPAKTAGLDPVHRAQMEARQALFEGRAEDALALLDAALLELRGAAPADLYGARAAALSRLGRFEEALAAATAEVGASFAVQLEAARAERGLGHNEAAGQRVAQLLERYPNFGPARLELVRWLTEDGREEEALAQCQWLETQAGEEVSVQLALARARFAAGQGPAALVQLDAWLAQHGQLEGGELVRELLVELLLADGQAELAHAEALQLVRPGADERSLLLALSASIGAGQHLDALRAMVYALDAAPRGVGALDRIAPLLEGSPLLVHVLQERARRAPGLDSEQRLLEQHLARGDAAAALARLQTFDPELRGQLSLMEGRALAQLGRIDEARAMLTARANSDGEAAYELGLLEAQAGHTEAALAAFTVAARPGGGLAADAHQARASLFERSQRFTEAAQALGDSLAADDARRDNWQRLARIARMRLGDRARAVEAYRRFFNLGGEDPDGQAYLDGAQAPSTGSPQ